MLMICPEATLAAHKRSICLARLDELASFIKSMPDELLDVRHAPVLEHGENTTIVGDWFAASSLLGQKRGYRQTVFTRHAPTVRNLVVDFDQQFEECDPWPGKFASPRLGALAFLGRLIAKLGT
jgi:hypothetical protein